MIVRHFEHGELRFRRGTRRERPAGWYWSPLPHEPRLDGYWIGPFATEQEARADALVGDEVTP